VVFERDFRFHESAPRETPITLARRHIGGAFGDRHQRPKPAARDPTVPGHQARLSTNLLHDVFGIIRGAIPIAELANNKSKGPPTHAHRLVGRCHVSSLLEAVRVTTSSTHRRLRVSAGLLSRFSAETSTATWARWKDS
jgi:hypothetical protein